MEADWFIDIGLELPWIDGSWSGFLDLRATPYAINTLPEPAQHPALRDALLALNAPASNLYTSKCDAWSVPGHEIDPDEFSARRQHAATGFASYIDILDRDPARFSSFALTEHRVRELTEHLHHFTINCARVDTVVRRAAAQASDSTEVDGYGITLYAAACGADPTAAYIAWQTALAAAVAATIAVAATRAGE
ncbi:MAG TPA: hypothetical protein VMU92_02170 [Acidobacteriaceae bacterium]|nr:hypothetical protein [Acidobacteriaceae bacterium]